MLTRLVLSFLMAVIACTAQACSAGRLSWPPSTSESAEHDEKYREWVPRWETAVEKPSGGAEAIATVRALVESSSSEKGAKVTEIRWVTPTEAMVETWLEQYSREAIYVSVVRKTADGWVILRRYFWTACYACG